MLKTVLNKIIVFFQSVIKYLSMKSEKNYIEDKKQIENLLSAVTSDKKLSEESREGLTNSLKNVRLFLNHAIQDHENSIQSTKTTKAKRNIEKFNKFDQE